MTTEDAKAWVGKNLPAILAMAGLVGGAGGMKFWDQAQIDRIEAESVAQGHRLDTAIDQLNRFQGSLDACLMRPALSGMPSDYYRGRDIVTNRAADPNAAAPIEEEESP